MGKQETPKTVAKSDTTRRLGAGEAYIDSVYQARSRADLQQLDKEFEKNFARKEMEKIQKAIDSINPVSNKNQSNPGSTSGGFSYKLKND